jgi:ATP-dependent DNA helicase RecG
MGSSKALGRHLASAELVYEYRTKDSSIPAQKRINFRDAFLKFYDAIWNEIELRNEIHPYQIGARILIIPTFNERVVREALLNAVTHRDYRLSGSVFVKQYPTRLMVESPGGFLPGITKENVLSRHQPRNRRLAETLARLGFVERSGQGIDLMFEKSIREGKATPDFSGTDDYQVLVTLNGEIKNPRFVTFLEQVGKEKGIEFTVEDLIVLDHIFRDQPIPDKLLSRLKGLEEEGLIERHRKHYVLARRFYGMIGKKGVYTRKVGLDRDAQEQLLEKHIRENDMDGSTMTELMQVLHNLSRAQVSAIIKRLARADRIHVRGVTKNARWYYGPKPESESL